MSSPMLLTEPACSVLFCFMQNRDDISSALEGLELLSIIRPEGDPPPELRDAHVSENGRAMALETRGLPDQLFLGYSIGDPSAPKLEWSKRIENAFNKDIDPRTGDAQERTPMEVDGADGPEVEIVRTAGGITIGGAPDRAVMYRGHVDGDRFVVDQSLTKPTRPPWDLYHMFLSPDGSWVLSNENGSYPRLRILETTEGKKLKIYGSAKKKLCGHAVSPSGLIAYILDEAGPTIHIAERRGEKFVDLAKQKLDSQVFGCSIGGADDQLVVATKASVEVFALPKLEHLGTYRKPESPRTIAARALADGVVAIIQADQVLIVRPS